MREKMFKIEDGILIKYTGSEENVKIPAGVKKIGYDAFRHNDHINTVSFPEGMVSICDYAFTGCHNLKFTFRRHCSGSDTVLSANVTSWRPYRFLTESSLSVHVHSRTASGSIELTFPVVHLWQVVHSLVVVWLMWILAAVRISLTLRTVLCGLSEIGVSFVAD